MTLIASYLTTDQQNIVNNKLVLQPRLELHVNLTRAHAILNEADTGFTIFILWLIHYPQFNGNKTTSSAYLFPTMT